MKKTKIEWTEQTWNPLVGCKEVSPGCQNCYAKFMAERLEKMAKANLRAGRDPGKKQRYIGLTERRGGHTVWTGAIHADAETMAEPFGWKKPRMVFVESMSDLYYSIVERQTIDRIFAVMALNDRHTFQVLTKRPERARSYFREREFNDVCVDLVQIQHAQPIYQPDKTLDRLVARFNVTERWHRDDGRESDLRLPTEWPLKNVWIGTSVEDQKRADERIPQLLYIPAAVRWLSVEPLLGPIEFQSLEGIDWVVIGGESGMRPRLCRWEWIRDILKQCERWNVPAFVKQFGSNSNFAGLRAAKGGDPREWPQWARVRQFPRKVAV